MSLWIIAAGLLAYFNSFDAPFLFDDGYFITDPVVRPYLSPWWNALLPPPHFQAWVYRPLVSLSLAFNYALGGLNVWGYHAVNLGIHLANGLLAFALLRRIFGRPAALAVALLWTVHPLQTESVTYIYQRAESIMALCTLLTLYGLTRAAESPGLKRWAFLAAAACVLGMFGKQTMVVVPALALLYDWIFLARFNKEQLFSRKWLHLILFASCGIVPLLLSIAGNDVVSNAGFGFKEITPLQYGLTQASVLLHYLRLSFWPDPLVLDYLWPVEKNPAVIAASGLAIALLLLATVWALRRRPELGFWGAWAFVILAPVSSFVPSGDPAAEHRMYLPLLGILALAVPPLARLLHGYRPVFFWGLIGAITVSFCAMTLERNEDYRDPVRLWQQTAAARPGNIRAWESIAELLHAQGRLEEAAGAYYQALKVKPAYGPAYDNLGVLYQQQGDTEQALTLYLTAVRLMPNDSNAYNHIGTVLLANKEWARSRAWFEKAIRLKPHFVGAHSNLGISYYGEGNTPEAIRHFEEALRWDPNAAAPRQNLLKAQSDAGLQTAR